MRRSKSNRPAWLGSSKSLLILLILLVATAIALLFFVFTSVQQESRIKLDRPVYQFFVNRRVDYEEGTSLLLGRYNMIFEGDNGRSDGDESPVYVQDADEVILPSAMGWTDLASGIEWQIPALSTIYRDEAGSIWCRSGKKETLLSGGFLSDEAGTYLFLDGAVLYLNGREYFLSPFSFYSSASGVIRVYDYDTQELMVVHSLAENARVTSVRHYQVDLTSGIYTDPKGVSKLLAADPSVLINISKK